MLELVAIPSVTGSDGGEDACAGFIYDRLSRIEYFRRNPDDLRFIELKNDALGRHSVGALLRATSPSKKTVIFLGHFDVVDVDVCGPLRDWAFDPVEYTARVGGLSLPEDVRSDLESGDYLFGRGVSDMKTGIAVGMCLLEDYAREDERDFNILLLAVPDEEADSAGMRGSVSFLSNLKEKEGLDFLACINIEPSFESGSPVVYYGTIGKFMPLYLCVGRESHAGKYYEGLNSTLVASYLNISLDGGLDTIETWDDQTFQPQCCLRMRDTRGLYAVTLPERSVLYYNCLTVHKTPAAILEEMRQKAMSAMKAALSHVGREDWEPRVLTVKEVIDKAYGVVGEKLFSDLPEPKMDERERNIEFLSRALDITGEKGPLTVIGFAPPFYPPRVNKGEDAREQAVRRASSVVGEKLKPLGYDLKEREVFQGITDLSFTGFQGSAEELGLLKANVPLWGRGFDLPMEELRKIDIPCVILGPLGKDSHKITERVGLDYSFNVLPFVLKDFTASILDRA
jgi:arginine utilization protein RocB